MYGSFQKNCNTIEVAHGKEKGTVPSEAKAILSAALHGKGPEPWAPVDAIYDRLAATGRTFSDSADLLREDRNR